MSRKPFALITFIFLLSCAATWFWLARDLPSVARLEEQMVRPTTQIVDRSGRLLYEVLDPHAGKQFDLNLTAVPEACVEATLATEDSRFYLHPGVDPIAIVRAAWQNFRAGGQVVSGGSTVTQQLARNLLLSPDERYQQSIQRKVREAILALKLEASYSKAELLALYLNQTYYGSFAFGLEAAAQVYFSKPAQQLSRAECTLLSGLVQYPSGYDPLQYPEVAKLRQRTVVRLMEEAGYITEKDAQMILAEPLRYRSNLFDIAAPHFVMYIQDLIEQELGVERLRRGGLRIVTTLDLDLQRQAERIVTHHLDVLNCRLPGLCDANTDPARRVDNAAAIVLDANRGDILVMVGSPDYFDLQIRGNVNATLTLRQPGSAIKPFTYAAAMDPVWSHRFGISPLTPATILPDVPTIFYVDDATGAQIPYEPVNYDRLFHGPVSVRTALANSYNVPAVKVLDLVGVEALQAIASAAGISSFTDEYGLALTLGGGEVSLLELTRAYGIFLHGSRLNTNAITDVQDMHTAYTEVAARSGGRPNVDGNGTHPPVLRPGTAYLITDILSDNVARIPAFGEPSALELPFSAAAKTGTTTDWRDNWTVGYSTQRIAGVWVGNADNTPMLDISGVAGAGPIWHDLMLAAHSTSPPPFQKPDTIVEKVICGPSGSLPSPACNRVYTEHFIVGTEPVEPDNQFQSIEVDVATGLRATSQTPMDRIRTRTYWVLPPLYREWMVAQNIPVVPPPAVESGSTTDELTADGTESIPQRLDHDADHARLILAAPAANSEFMLHPSMPKQHQRIALAGRTSTTAPWHELRLLHNGEVLDSLSSASEIEVWWELAPGEHDFWLEGEVTAGAPTTQSEARVVLVQAFQQPTQERFVATTAFHKTSASE